MGIFSYRENNAKPSYQTLKFVKEGFIEAMYFADGCTNYAEMQDGSFDNESELTNKALKNIDEYLTIILSLLPDEIYENVTLDSIGNSIYFQSVKLGTGFEYNELSNTTMQALDNIFERVYIECYDDSENDNYDLNFEYRLHFNSLDDMIIASKNNFIINWQNKGYIVKYDNKLKELLCIHTHNGYTVGQKNSDNCYMGSY